MQEIVLRLLEFRMIWTCRDDFCAVEYKLFASDISAVSSMCDVSQDDVMCLIRCSMHCVSAAVTCRWLQQL